MSHNQYYQDWKVCRKIAREQKNDFSWALRALPRNTRRAIEILGAFFVLAPKLHLDIWQAAFDQKNGWEDMGGITARPVAVLRATSRVCKEYGIPYKYSEAFIEAAQSEGKKQEYQTYGELEKHMYGSAGVIAIMIAHVIGFTDKRALLFAEELGYAVELTNVLRHLSVDLEINKKIYLPKAELDSFGITKEQLLAHKVDEAFERFMGFQMSRARALFVSADEGISLIREESRLAVRLFAALSEAMLDEIERRGFDVFGKPIKISWVNKLKITMSVKRAERQR